MSLCALVLERVNIREDGKVRQKLGRIIIGFEDENTHKKINFISKYIHYPVAEFVHSHVCWLYNGIDANTLSTQGEKYSSVIDWARAAICSRKVIVHGAVDVHEVVGRTPCTLIDLQEFFYSAKTELIMEPISLARLVKKFFNLDLRSARGARDPFDECALKISLYHVMCAYNTCGIAPPFSESMFPKVTKMLPVAPPKNSLTCLENQGTKTTTTTITTTTNASKSPRTPPVSPKISSCSSKPEREGKEGGEEEEGVESSRDTSLGRFQGEDNLSQSLKERLKVTERRSRDVCTRLHTYENDESDDVYEDGNDDDDDDDVKASPAAATIITASVDAAHNNPEYFYSSQVFKPSHFAALGHHQHSANTPCGSGGATVISKRMRADRDKNEQQEEQEDQHTHTECATKPLVRGGGGGARRGSRTPDGREKISGMFGFSIGAGRGMLSISNRYAA